MPFEGDGGWGKCTLRSKNPIAASTGSSPSFTVYEFALPESYYTMPLALGQQLEFCCLSSSDDICTGSFYPYNKGGEGEDGTKGATAGVVRVVLPNDREGDEGSSKFVSCVSFIGTLCIYKIFHMETLIKTNPLVIPIYHKIP